MRTRRGPQHSRMQSRIRGDATRGWRSECRTGATVETNQGELWSRRAMIVHHDQGIIENGCDTFPLDCRIKCDGTPRTGCTGKHLHSPIAEEKHGVSAPRRHGSNGTDLPRPLACATKCPRRSSATLEDQYLAVPVGRANDAPPP